MDHYKALGLNRNATKKEIKEAFRELAVKYHPDKHCQSSKAVREDATLRFKQISEAYEVLSDDRKRSNYNIHYNSHNRRGGGYGHYYNNYGYGYGYGYGYNGYGQKGAASATKYGDGFVYKLEIVLRFMTTRAFLLNFAFAGALFAGIYAIDKVQEEVWRMNNSGKSFEAAMESIEKAKAQARKDEI